MSRGDLRRATADLLEQLEWHALGGDQVAADAVGWIRSHELDALNLAAWRDACAALAAAFNAAEVDLPPGDLLAGIRARAEQALAWVNDQPSPAPTIVLDRAAALSALRAALRAHGPILTGVCAPAVHTTSQAPWRVERLVDWLEQASIERGRS